jgi:predicted DNA-binding transcriptional regulator YafY
MRPDFDRISTYCWAVADVTERMLALLSTLQSGRSFSGQELAVRLGVSPRTVRRDVDRLRGYGYPVDAQRGPAGHYRLRAGRTMPPVVLDDGEAVAALAGLAVLASTNSGDAEAIDTAATRAYGKLDQVLPTRLRPQVASLRASLETREQRGPGVAAALVAGLAEAIANREVVRFGYRDRRDAPSLRRVEPHRQVHLRMRWYLLAWDLDRGDWRVFRLDRVTEFARTTARYEPRALPADTAVDYLREGMNAYRHRIRLVVHAPPPVVADALKYHDADIERADSTTTRVTVWLDAWEWLIPQLALLGVDFTIAEPAHVRTACETFAGRLLAAARPAAAPDRPVR